MATVHVIMTGGTIDSYYEGAKDTVIPHKKSVIPNYLKSLRLYTKFRFTQSFMKDSRNVSKSDMKKILRTVEKSPCKNIIITHGTYTMPDTARFLADKLKKKDKKIIITGSMIPLDGFNFTDASFNLGYSLASLDNLEAGIYICMNGRIFSSQEATKIIPKGRFVSLFAK